MLRCNRAAGYMALRRYREAARDCTAALVICPEYRKALLRRARCHARLKMYGEAKKDYEVWLASEGESEAKETESVKREVEEVRKAIREQQRESDRNKWFENNFSGTDGPQSQENFRGYRKGGGGAEQAYRGPHPNRSRGGSSSGYGGAGGRGVPPFGRRHSDYGNAGPPKATGETTHYQILGVSDKADSTAIKKAYHKLVLMYHPDKNQASDAADKFRAVQTAYEIVGGEERRKYDTELMSRRFSYR